MKKYIFITLAFFISTQATASNRCVALLQEGIKDELRLVIDDKHYNEMHTAICTDNESLVDKKKKLDLGTAWGAFFGKSSNRANYRNSMCSSNDNIAADSSFTQLVRNTINAPILNAFVSCEKLAQGGIELQVDKGKDQSSIAFNISFSRGGAPGAKLDITGYTITPSRHQNSVECKGNIVNATEDAPVSVTQVAGSAQLVCSPKKALLESDDNDFSVFILNNLQTIHGWLKPEYKGKISKIEALSQKLDAHVKQNKVDIDKAKQSLNNRMNKAFAASNCTYRAAAQKTVANSWQAFACPAGEFARGVSFHHPAGKDLTYQESVRVLCCPFSG